MRLERERLAVMGGSVGVMMLVHHWVFPPLRRMESLSERLVNGRERRPNYF